MSNSESQPLVEIERMVKKPFKKHHATIFIRGNLSTLERKLWNLVTKNAYFELGKKREHKVDIRVLCDVAGYNSKDLNPIKESLTNLVSSSIEWIQEDKNGEVTENEDWATTSFLSYAKIKRGVLTYEYSSFLTERLVEPEVYARLNLATQKNLSKGRSLPLYEITATFRENGKFPGKTPVWSLGYFRALMGAESELYNQFKFLNQKIISPNVEKVNAETDIFIEPIFHKTGRSYSGIQFSVKNNPQIPLFKPKEFENIPVFQSMVNHGVSILQAEQFLEIHPEEYLQRKIGLLERQIAGNKIKSSPSGYLVRAIKEDYSDEDPQALLKEAEEKKQQIKRDKEAEKRRKEEEIKEVEKIRVEKERGLVEKILTKFSEDELQEIKDKFYNEELKEVELYDRMWRDKGVDHAMIKSDWRKYILENYS